MLQETLAMLYDMQAARSTSGMQKASMSGLAEKVVGGGFEERCCRYVDFAHRYV